MKTFSFESIGTSWQIEIHDEISKEKFLSLKEDVFIFLKDFTLTYSRFEKNSLISKISESKGEFKFPKSSKELFSIYKNLYDLTNRLVTPLIGDTLNSLGYDENYSLKPKSQVLSPQKWEVMDFKYPILKTKKPIILDFGACGKGYTIDCASKILKKYKIKSFLIDAGGDIYLHNIPNAKIGLENPLNIKQIIGISYINNLSICASALNRRKWDKYSHIINPKTLKSPEDILAVWVVSKEAVVADAISTALFLVEPEKLQKGFDFEYLILFSNQTIKKSVNFPAEIYYN